MDKIESVQSESDNKRRRYGTYLVPPVTMVDAPTYKTRHTSSPFRKGSTKDLSVVDTIHIIVEGKR